MVRRGMIAVLSLGWSATMLLLLGFHIGHSTGEDREVAATQPETVQAQMIVFPCKAGDSGLVVLGMGLYEGQFAEDGSDRPVVDAAALLVTNTLTQPIERGAVLIEMGEEELVFEVFALPPGETALVVEAQRKPYSAQKVDTCDGWAVEGWWNSAADVLAVTEQGMGTLEVTNPTALPVYNVRILYKSFDGESGIYIGGNCYEITVDAIPPGQTVSISPYHYASGYSRVVAVLSGE